MYVLADIGSWYVANETPIQQILIYALLAFSVQIALRAGVFSLAGIGFYGIGGYTAGLLVKDHHVSPALAILAAVGVTLVFGYLLALLLVRLRDLYLGMATLAFDLMVGVVALNWISLTGGPQGVIGVPVSVTTLWVFITVTVVAAFLVLLETGTVGRSLLAIREDEELSQTLSIDVRRYRRFAFVISCVPGAIAGAFHALLFLAVQPTDAGFELVVLALTMVILGGFMSWGGALIGAIVLTWVPLQLSSIGRWWGVVYGALLIGMATFAPGGLLGVSGSLMRSERMSQVRGFLRRRGREPKAAQSGSSASPEGS